MKLYIIPAVIAAVAFGAWKLYAHGYDVAELENRAGSAEALRAAESEQARIAAKASKLQLKAEVRATQIEERSKAEIADAWADAEAAMKRENPGCPDQCFSVSWPSQ